MVTFSGVGFNTIASYYLIRKPKLVVIKKPNLQKQDKKDVNKTKRILEDIDLPALQLSIRLH